MQSNLIQPVHFDGFSAKWLKGHVQIFRQHAEGGDVEKLIDRRNNIMYQASDLIARALIGRGLSGITHMYVGYSNSLSLPANNYTIDKAVTAFQVGANLGWLRVPLTYPAVATSSNAGLYTGNLLNFSVLLNNPASYVQAGSATLTNNTSRFFEIGLVAATNPNSSAGDMMLARVAFSSITYQQNYNLTVNWGILITSE